MPIQNFSHLDFEASNLQEQSTVQASKWPNAVAKMEAELENLVYSD